MTQSEYDMRARRLRGGTYCKKCGRSVHNQNLCSDCYGLYVSLVRKQEKMRDGNDPYSARSFN
ncbi:MAG: hypothetical protein HQL30_09700 [Candidatus Omnitrophica bacterium]|nr:hypothetical protein [Candidatus Omnitrophota bacterium]